MNLRNVFLTLLSYDPSRVGHLLPGWRAWQRLKGLEISMSDCPGLSDSIRYIGGADVSYDGDKAVAGLVVLSYPDLKPIYHATELIENKFPYIPEFLDMREAPAIARLVRDFKRKVEHDDKEDRDESLLTRRGFIKRILSMHRIRLDSTEDHKTEDVKVEERKLLLSRRSFLRKFFGMKEKRHSFVLLVDGSGAYHQRGMGSACHVGILTDTVTIGVAKSFYPISNLSSYKCDQIRKLSLKSKGDSVVLDVNGLYAALKTTDKANPIFVSVGHKISLKTALKLVLNCSNSRIPEPIRLADSFTRFLVKLRAKNNSWAQFQAQRKNSQGTKN